MTMVKLRRCLGKVRVRRPVMSRVRLHCLSLCIILAMVFALHITIHPLLDVNSDSGKDTSQTVKDAQQSPRQPVVDLDPDLENDYGLISEELKVKGLRDKRIFSNGDCPDLKPPESVVESFDFQPVNGPSAVYVYSAHPDTLNEAITIVAISNEKHSVLFCQLWTRTGTGTLGAESMATLRVVKAKVVRIPGGHENNHEYSSVFIMCPVSPHGNVQPYAVSVVTIGCEWPDNVLAVVNTQRRQKQSEQIPPMYNFTVCVKPFNFNYSKTVQLVEFIELSRILGADSFIFYDYSTSPGVLSLLQHYNKKVLAKVLPWKLPVKVRTWPPSEGSQLHAFGQLASSNDCLHRQRQLSSFVVFVDLDEFIIPTIDEHYSWHDIVQERLRLIPGASAFMFRNLFVRKDWSHWEEDRADLKTVFSEEQLALLGHLHLDSLKHITREISPLVFGKRSKFIVNPRKTLMVDIHQPSLTVSEVDRVSEETALLYHYRDWEKPLQAGTRSKSTYVPNKYGHLLLKRVENVLNEIHFAFDKQN